jgi:predicted MFS family arabinose efflux permease
VERHEPEIPGSASLFTPAILLITGAAFASMFGFQMLLSVVPLYTSGIGGGSTGAGTTTGVFMFATVLAQIQMPRILRRFGYRSSLAAGIVLLGVPAFLYVFSETVSSVLAVTTVRGIGFGVVTVVFAALLAELAPPGRRGEALGLLGIAITVPTIFGNALGLWIVANYGFSVVFVLGAAVPLFGVVSALAIRSAPEPDRERGAGFFAGLSRGPLLRVMLLFCSMTIAAGVVLTFLPLAKPGAGLFSATGALLFFGVSVTIFRWWAGRYADRSGNPGILLLPGLVAAALGVAALAADGFLLLLGAVLFGAGFGLLQNSTLLLTMERVSKKEYGLGSTLWNVAFDLGTGLGAFMFGFIIAATGFSAAFYICAALLAATLIIIPIDRRLSR